MFVRPDHVPFVKVKVTWVVKELEVTGKQFYAFIHDIKDGKTWSLIVDMKDEDFGEACFLMHGIAPFELLHTDVETEIGPPFYVKVQGTVKVID
jgi:hypothetical protein